MNGYRMRKAVLFAVVAVVCSLAAAQQKTVKTPYPEARRMYDQFDKTLSKALLWEKTTIQDRTKAINDATRLRDVMSKAFGDFSQCSRAATAHVDFVSNLNGFAAASQLGTTVKPFEVLAAMRSAETFGNSRAPCYDEVEALDVSAKK